MSVQRNLVVIGTSAGGVEALPRVIGPLPADFPGAVVVVQHMAEQPQPMLVHIIQRQSKIRVSWAGQGDRLEPGNVYVAPPGSHLMLVDDHVQLLGGPRENFVRPSIDRTMRSAAAKCGPRTVGVLLTGMLDDGVAGMLALQAAGGYTIVQEPSSAQFPDLPARALQAMQPDRVMTLDEMPSAFARLTREPAPDRAPPDAIVAEAELDLAVVGEPEQLAKLGPQSSISCPDCGGPMWDVGTPQLRRYRCYLGHVASATRVLREGDAKIEGAMWSAIRALHERAVTYDTLAADSKKAGSAAASEVFTTKAAEAREQVELARAFMARVGST